ncbi:MAG: hypothetical protein KatS3mg034_1266 [Vicingaceae bacterium]|nr:MAG: hypothetical protein KatS3mg034_1266 [Vicingaceae bacterium]
MQNLYIGEFNINDSLGITNANSQFLVRRARIKIDGFAYSPKLTYKIELGLTSRDLAIVSPETRNTPGIVYDMF